MEKNTKLKYAVIVKTSHENEDMVDFLMNSFQTRFQKEFRDQGSVTVVRDYEVKDL